ncbi:MAG: hypothetical protein P8099_17410, partial [Gemmatimonadota bacterium]
MRKIILPLIAAVSVAGCYHYQAPAPTGPAAAHDTWYGQNAPMQASIWFNDFTGDMTIDVSQPAYTTVFLIRPGMGASMVYPRYRDGANRVTQGSHRLYAYETGFGGYGWQNPFSRWGFSSFGYPYGGYGYGFGYPYGFGGYGYGYRYGGYGHGYPFGYGYPYGYGFGGYGYYGYNSWAALNMSRPMYLVLVASSEPLRTDEFLYGQQTMSMRFASYNLAQTVNAITDDVVLFPEYANWTTATEVVWPQAPPLPFYRSSYAVLLRPQLNPFTPERPTFAAPGAWRAHPPEMPRMPGDTLRRVAPSGGPGTPVPLNPAEPGRIGKPDPLKPEVPSVPVKPVDGSPKAPPLLPEPRTRTPRDAQPRVGVPAVPRSLAPTPPPGRVTAPSQPPEERPTARRPATSRPASPPPAMNPGHSSTHRASPASAPRASRPRSTPAARPAPRPAARPAPRPAA